MGRTMTPGGGGGGHVVFMAAMAPDFTVSDLRRDIEYRIGELSRESEYRIGDLHREVGAAKREIELRANAHDRDLERLLAEREQAGDTAGPAAAPACRGLARQGMTTSSPARRLPGAYRRGNREGPGTPHRTRRRRHHRRQ